MKLFRSLVHVHNRTAAKNASAQRSCKSEDSKHASQDYSEGFTS